jgi:hypothetical protein
LAVEIARIQGIFPAVDNAWDVDNDKKNIEKATNDVASKLANWQLQLEKSSLVAIDASPNSDKPIYEQVNKPTVIPFLNLNDNSSKNIGQFINEGVEHLTSTDVKNLNNDQR